MSLAEYQILARVADGGQGIIFKCKHKSTEEVVIVKVENFENSEDLNESLIECMLTSKLEHNNIIKIKQGTAMQTGYIIYFSFYYR